VSQHIHIDPATPTDLEPLRKRFHTVQVGSYSHDDRGIGGGYTLVGFDTDRTDESHRFLASELLVLHVHSYYDAITGSRWIAQGIIANIDDDQDFTQLLELVIREAGVDGAQVTS
jgi:hypothetical protein